MIRCVNFTSFDGGYCKGYADIEIPEHGMVIPGFALFEKEGKRWISFPSKPYQDKSTGETKRSYSIKIPDKDQFNDFRRKVMNAVDKYIGGMNG